MLGLTLFLPQASLRQDRRQETKTIEYTAPETTDWLTLGHMNITSEIFDAYLKCPTKCFLRAHGESGSGNEYADWMRTHGEAYRVEGLRRMTAAMSPGDCVTDICATKNLEVARWRVAMDLAVRTGNLESRIHAVERIPAEGRGRAAQFIPIRFIFTNKLSKDDKMLVAFDALVLSEMSGRALIGKIIYGDDHSTLKIKTEGVRSRARKLTEKIAALLSADNPPDIVLNRRCGECEFQVRCRQKAIEKDDLSLLSGMGEKERKKLNSKGIFTVNQLSFTFRSRKPRRRAKNPSVPRYYALQAQAIREKMVYIHGTPEIPNSEPCLYFDIEGVPWRESYYLIGVLLAEASGTQYRAFWADDEAGQASILREFCRFVGGFSSARLLHYGRYDLKALREMGRLIPENERNVFERVLCTTFNVLTVVHSHLYFPLHSIRLREVANFLGYSFTSGIGSGMESIGFREKWRISRDEDLKNQLVAYNREDCEALKGVCDFIKKGPALALATERVPGRAEQIAVSESLRTDDEGKRPKFGKAEFVLPEFEKLNRCAYFDYQRDRVYARVKKRRSQLHHRPPHTVRRASQGTVIVVKCGICTKCGSNRLSPKRTVRRRLIDLKFFKTGIGVKRWQPHYTIHQYRCRCCGATVTPPGVLFNATSRTIYGHNLMCWCLYHNIVGKQSLLQTEKSLYDIFGLRLPYRNVYRFRSVIAAYYRPLRDEILRTILDDDVINIDETPVNLRKTTGYVWALATADKICYLYRESREGEFLKELLSGFSGVLVSDFFTAYDSLDCSHQKCLVHLMRDINDDLRRRPFDEELRYVAQEFGRFLVKAVSTIDRWGLKARHLHKHLKDADTLLRRICRKRLASEHAMKYQKRFEKNADSLFTFLRHDNVPWNNNNAEHALNYFAKMRRFTDGTFTSASIDKLLTLATVIQTCEYSSVNPLRFFLSGETSLAEMTKRRR